MDKEGVSIHSFIQRPSVYAARTDEPAIPTPIHDTRRPDTMYALKTSTLIAPTRRRHVRQRGEEVKPAAKGRNSRLRNAPQKAQDDADAAAIEAREKQARGGGNRKRAASTSSSSSTAAYDNKKLTALRREAERKRADETQKREAFDRKYAARSAQGVPQVVTDRMLKRVGIFCGTPLILGFMTGPAYYVAKKVMDVDVPPAVFFAASSLTFGAAFVGISYGVLSASWDPRREGSFWGTEEFKQNIPILISTIMGKASGEVPMTWDDEAEEDS